jgi:hypothetical protein
MMARVLARAEGKVLSKPKPKAVSGRMYTGFRLV